MEFQTLQKDMIAALKAGQKERKESISLLVADITKSTTPLKNSDANTTR